MRIVVIGGPRCGKTTRAKALAATGVPARHTDDLIGRLDWSAASAEVSRWFALPGPWVIEGVAAVRALRKWLAAHGGKPCDTVEIMRRPFEPLSPGQASMLKSFETVWAEIAYQLRARGVAITG